MPGPHFTEPVDPKARRGCTLGRFQFRAALSAPGFSIPVGERKHRETLLLVSRHFDLWSGKPPGTDQQAQCR
jgi:hypothetical protein